MGPEFARGRATTFLIVAAVVFVGLLALVVVTSGNHPLSTWLILLYVGKYSESMRIRRTLDVFHSRLLRLYNVSVWFSVLVIAVARSLYYFTMKVSVIEGLV